MLMAAGGRVPADIFDPQLTFPPRSIKSYPVSGPLTMDEEFFHLALDPHTIEIIVGTPETYGRGLGSARYKEL